MEKMYDDIAASVFFFFILKKKKKKKKRPKKKPNVTRIEAALSTHCRREHDEAGNEQLSHFKVFFFPQISFSVL
jgi:hypothetical protein